MLLLFKTKAIQLQMFNAFRVIYEKLLKNFTLHEANAFFVLPNAAGDLCALFYYNNGMGQKYA
jgi:hypothetical protein